MCSFQILKPSEKKTKYQYGGMNTGRPVTPPRAAALTTGAGAQQAGMNAAPNGMQPQQQTANNNNNNSMTGSLKGAKK